MPFCNWTISPVVLAWSVAQPWSICNKIDLGVMHFSEVSSIIYWKSWKIRAWEIAQNQDGVQKTSIYSDIKHSKNEWLIEVHLRFELFLRPRSDFPGLLVCDGGDFVETHRGLPLKSILLQIFRFRYYYWTIWAAASKIRTNSVLADAGKGRIGY